MQETAVTVPDTKIIDEQAFNARLRATEITISDDAGYKAAGSFLQIIKDLMGKVAGTFDPAIAAAHLAHKAMIDAKKIHSVPLEEAERVVKDKMATYYREQERLRRDAEEKILAEQRAHEAEERRVREQAERAAREAAAANRPAPPPPPPPAPVAPVTKLPPRPVASGVTVKKVWKAEVIDLPALVRAVANGEQPISLLLPNESALNKEAKRVESASTIPGVHFYAEESVGVR